MSVTSAENYRARFRKVLEYIDTHLCGDLSIELLSGVAAFSKYHFHRKFSKLFGIGIYKYVQLCRMKRASYQLAFRSHSQVIDIALANGYEGPESFARAFKKINGQSPSDFRKQPQWNPWHTTYQPLSELRINHMKTARQTEQVKVINFSDTKIAVFEHRGDPRLIGNSVRRFIEWRKQNHLPPKISATFDILYDNPAEVAPESFRLDICAAVDQDVADNKLGVISKTIPGGRCAVLRHIGSDDTLGETINYLYSEWLPQSGEELRDFPAYLQRILFFPDVPESEAITDVFLPLSLPSEHDETFLGAEVVTARARPVLDAFYDAVVACGRKPLFKPSISVATTPEVTRYDPVSRAIVLLPYEVLQPPRRAAMDRFAAIGTLGLSGREQYIEVFNDLLVAHELGHWLQETAQRPLNRWQAEYQANQIMVAFWREHPAAPPAAATELRLANFIAQPPNTPNLMPNNVGMSIEDYFNAHLAEIESNPMAYAGFQKMMVRQAISERPAPSFRQVMATVWPK